MKIKYYELIMKLQHIILIVLLIVPAYLSGQSLNDAKKWYQEGNYEEAKPVFEEAYEKTPNNAELNHWLGVIAFNEGKYLKSQKFLEFASQKKITESYLYLGQLYGLLYKFDAAEKEFVKYEKAQRRNKAALAKLDEKRDDIDRLERMVGRTEDVQIIDSIVVSKSDFLSAYKLSASAGSLQPVNKFFKNNESAGKSLFMSERKDKVYYSHDVNGESKLFSMEKLLDDFGNEKPLSDAVNQSGSQAYPFVMNDGVTIYFASTGHESLGGYDLYVTRYNYNTNSYLSPNQLNMPFNSPFNDYMMVIDEEKGVGWFASDRFQEDGFVCIYTFIPSSRVVLIDDEDEDYLAGRARISSIQDTWKAGVDYSDMIELAKAESTEDKEDLKDFEFVINDNITYYTLADFKHGSSRALFMQSIDLSSKLEKMKEELDYKREQFANGSRGDAVKSSILELEENIRSTELEVKSLMMRARNEEIRNTF